MFQLINNIKIKGLHELTKNAHMTGKYGGTGHDNICQQTEQLMIIMTMTNLKGGIEYTM